ncbi:DUF3467 domain-containing protein [Candidatus Woesearchaeota archaeon]|nr:DUF3467 domain-containing protein [Candidatus Woesearchaeota archaeon]
MEDKRMGVQELDRQPLYCNQMTVSHSPTQFFLDFRLVYPQFSPDNQQATVALHKLIVLEPYHLKETIKVLQENVQRYEKAYGKITTPKAVERAKKAHKSTGAISAPEYMG